LLLAAKLFCFYCFIDRKEQNTIQNPKLKDQAPVLAHCQGQRTRRYRWYTWSVEVLFSTMILRCQRRWTLALLFSTSSSKHFFCRAMSHRIAVAQMQSTSSKLDNLYCMAYVAGQAHRQGACVLFLPENCGFMGASMMETLEHAERPLEGETAFNINSVSSTVKKVIADALNQAKSDDSASESVSTANLLTLKETQELSLVTVLQYMAHQTGLWLSVGGVHIQVSDSTSADRRVYNAHLIINHQGTIMAVYRKVHLFDVHIPGKVKLQESATTSPGYAIVVCDSPIGT
jgi:predicted amidohydrolase